MPTLFHKFALAALTICAATQSFGQQTNEQENATILAMRLATPIAGTSTTWREGLKSAYISTYGDIDDIPKNWEALVRRTLVCDANQMAKCVDTSISALDQIGGVASLQLGNLLEVRKFGLNLGLLMDELTTARVKLAEPFQIREVVTTQPPQASPKLAAYPQVDVARTSDLWNVTWYWIAAASAFFVALFCALVVWPLLKRKKLLGRTDSIASPASDPEIVKAVVLAEDPLVVSAREIVDALHQAESDAETLVAMILSSGITGTHVDIVKFWRQAVKAGKQSAMAELEHRGVAVQLKALATTDDITMLVGRLLEHAALYSSILLTQQKQDSAIFHWSRQLPSALINLHWSFKTRKYMGELKNKSIFSFEVSKAPITMRDTQVKPDDFFQRAARAAITT